MVQPATAAVRLLSGEREPVRVATTANIDLAGLQTVDGIALAVNDRVLVKNQTDARENGIYTSSTGRWSRASDASFSRAISAGITVQVVYGDTHGGQAWRFDTFMPNIGVDDILLNFYLSADLVGDAEAAVQNVISLATEQAERAEDAADLAVSAISGGIAPKATVELATLDAPAVDPEYYDIAYFDTSYQSGSGAKYRKVASEPSHPGKFQNANGTWFEIDAQVLTPEMFGARGDGTTDDTTAFENFAASSVALRRFFHAFGSYAIEPTDSIEMTEGGVFLGDIIISKANAEATLLWQRDDPTGEVVSTSGWAASLTRGMVNVQATNAYGKTVFLVSTEVLIQRKNPPDNVPYYKQEAVQVHTPDGRLSRGLVCTYTNKANLTATAHDTDRPVTVKGLRVRYTGTTGSGPTDGCLYSRRDFITFEDSQFINESPAQALAVGHNMVGVGATLIRPKVIGFQFEGIGYGVIGSLTLGMKIYDGDMLDCRHAFTGRHNTDCLIQGGRWSVIDDHWLENMTIRDLEVNTGQYGDGAPCIWVSGNDLTIDNVTAFGGRGLVGISLGTPHLGGTVNIRNIRHVSRSLSSGFYHLIGYTSPEGDTDPQRTDVVRMADVLNIENITLEVSIMSYLVYVGAFAQFHKTYFRVNISGDNFNLTGNGLGIAFGYKNSTYTDRAPTFTVTGGSYTVNNAVYVVANDTVETWGWNFNLIGVEMGAVRISARSVNLLEVQGGSLGTVTNDTGTAVNSIRVFSDVRFSGGAIGSIANALFKSCLFAGTMTAMPAGASYKGNVKIGTQAALPADITNNVTSPFS